ncbi:MAG TPA: FTR1 family protein [Gammaproteobacteria bacterium]|nr:FTR1 family protein [Gammaproteobacteria bacterium]
MGQVLFIVWRESVEAILVVGIVFAWLRQHPDGARGLRYMWLGVAVGLAMAVILGLGLLGVNEVLQGNADQLFQTGMVLVAAGLIVQMVVWMRRHGRTLKRELEQGANEAVQNSHYIGLAVLVALAVAREGAEMVVFLYGMGAATLSSGGLVPFVGSALVGFVLALATFWALQLGSRLFSWRNFFRVTEVMLLFLAAALLMSGVDKLLAMGWLPAGIDPLWNTAWLLDDSTRFGGLVSALTGYRAYPALTHLIVYALYWIGVSLLLGWRPLRRFRAVAHAG